MKTKIFGLLLSTTFILCGFFVSGQDTERPFKGRIVGSFLMTPTADPTIYHSEANATGEVTLLGTFSKLTIDAVNIVSSTIEGSFVMTSIAGAEIRGSYSGIFSFGSTPGTFSWALNAKITGGTGRFCYATGELVFIAKGSYVITGGAVTGNYIETIEGTIQF